MQQRTSNYQRKWSGEVKPSVVNPKKPTNGRYKDSMVVKGSVNSYAPYDETVLTSAQKASRTLYHKTKGKKR